MLPLLALGVEATMSFCLYLGKLELKFLSRLVLFKCYHLVITIHLTEPESNTLLDFSRLPFAFALFTFFMPNSVPVPVPSPLTTTFLPNIMQNVFSNVTSVVILSDKK